MPTFQSPLAKATRPKAGFYNSYMVAYGPNHQVFQYLRSCQAHCIARTLQSSPWTFSVRQSLLLQLLWGTFFENHPYLLTLQKYIGIQQVDIRKQIATTQNFVFPIIQFLDFWTDHGLISSISPSKSSGQYTHHQGLRNHF